MHTHVSSSRLAAIAAFACFAVVVVAFGAAFPVYSQWLHPVAMLGGSGVPRAGAFNILAFVVPGLLCAFVAWRRRSRVGRVSWPARIGLQALVLAAIAFAAQGLAPLDSHDLESPQSALHGAAWTFWWVAFAAGAVLVAVGSRGTALSAVGRRVLVCAAVTLLFALVLPAVLPAGLSQRVAFAAWFVAVLRLAAPVSRNAA